MTDDAGPVAWSDWRGRSLSTPALKPTWRAPRPSLDLFALLTIWLAVLPLTQPCGLTPAGLGRSAASPSSLVFGVDLAIRSRLSARPWQYAVRHRC